MSFSLLNANFEKCGYSYSKNPVCRTPLKDLNWQECYKYLLKCEKEQFSKLLTYAGNQTGIFIGAGLLAKSIIDLKAAYKTGKINLKIVTLQTILGASAVFVGVSNNVITMNTYCEEKW